MNADHADALIQLARMFAGMESTQASMTSIDRLGFHVRLKTKDGMRGARIAFSREVKSVGSEKCFSGDDGTGAAEVSDLKQGRHSLPRAPARGCLSLKTRRRKPLQQ